MDSTSKSRASSSSRAQSSTPSDDAEKPRKSKKAARSEKAKNKAEKPRAKPTKSEKKAGKSSKRSSKKSKKTPARPPAYTDALIAFMMRDWAPSAGGEPPPIANAKAFEARRRALSKAFPGETLIVPTGHEKTRSNDTTYRFRPGSDFFYLTGNLEPDCVLVMVPKGKTGHTDVLFVEPNNGRKDKTFFTDHAKGELWVGPRLGVPESRARFGIDRTESLRDLEGTLKRTKGKRRVLRGHSAKVDAFAVVLEKDMKFAEALSEMRLLKDELEIAELEAVVASTKRAFEDVIRELKTAKTEREVEGTFNKRARVEGNDVGYGTIAASGANACILHWTRNDAPLSKSDLLLLDAGVEGNALYTADITRTVPISGKFSKEQREVYDLVEAAQAAALDAAKPGNDFMEPNRQAQRVLAEGLAKMGILSDAEHALQTDQQLQRRYTLHNVSHMLGIDVHDCAKARQEVYRYGKLKPGMVLTVEPGLYFQPNDLTVPEKYRGIGVRIEDDILITEDGMRNLSESMPRKSDEVEQWMADVWGRDG